VISADYVIVIEKAEGNYGAWCPDLPGVVALGETEDECVESMRSAIAFHIEGLIEDGDPVPPPAAVAARTVHIEAA
jgi:predicted RNase H-like HicB family nuclease